MISQSVTVNRQDVKEAVALFEFIGGNSNDAVRVAINKTLPKVRTKSSVAIRQQIRLSAGYLTKPDPITGKARLGVVKATRTKLSGSISTPKRGLLLSRFSTDSQISNGKTSWILPPPLPPRGIKVKIKPKGSPKPFSKKAFYMVLPGSKALAIVVRRENPGKQGGLIDVAYGPSISQVFTTVKDDVYESASDDYQTEVLRAVEFLLRKQYPKD